MSINNSSAAKLTIVGLDVGDPQTAAAFISVEAQYNPKEIGISKTVPWQKAPTSTGDQPELTFTSGESRTMSFELFFDTYEQGTDVHALYVTKLQQLALIMDADGEEIRKRPPLVRVLWGTGLPAFYGVIESVDTKYTMFLPSGVAVRAMCSIRLKEANRASFRKNA